MAYPCETCGLAFPTPSKLATHRARKTPCSPDDAKKPAGRACPRCARTFGRPSEMRRHLEAGTCTPPQAEEEAETEPATAPTSHAAAAMSTTARHLFGEEDVALVDPAALSALLRKYAPPACTSSETKEGRAALARSRVRILEGVAVLIYCDPQRPENMTICAGNAKHPGVVSIWTAEGWTRHPLAMAMEQMAEKCLEALDAHTIPDDDIALTDARLVATHEAATVDFIPEKAARGLLLGNADTLTRRGDRTGPPKGRASPPRPGVDVLAKAPAARPVEVAPDLPDTGPRAELTPPKQRPTKPLPPGPPAEPDEGDPALFGEGYGRRPRAASSKMEALFDVEGWAEEEGADLERVKPAELGWHLSEEERQAEARRLARDLGEEA